MTLKTEKVQKQAFDAALRRLVKSPPLPLASIPKKRRVIRRKPKPATPR